MTENPLHTAARPAMADYTVLYTEDGSAMTIPESVTEPLDALIALLSEDYGGEIAEWSRDNPVLLAALPDVRIEIWHSCTKAWCESEGIDPDEWTSGYWAGNGDGERSLRVIWYADNIYDLGEEAEEAEHAKTA